MIGIDPVTTLALGWMFGRKFGLLGPGTPVAPGTPPPPAVQPTSPAGVPFPSGVTSTEPKPGFRKAVEVFRIVPGSMPGGTLVGADDAAVAMREREFPRGWQPVPQSQVTSSEMARAVQLLSSWKKGRVVFEGPRSSSGRRAFVMTEHPKPAAQPTTPARSPAPVGPPGATVPASFPTVTPAAPPPRAPAPSLPPPPPPVQATQPRVMTVRTGEGLINMVRRAWGDREHDNAWIDLRAANVPNDADGRPRRKIALTDPHPDAKGGILPRLSPGQRLFVPPDWPPIDPANL